MNAFEILSALFIAVSGGVGFGAAITFLIQLGKKTGWKVFADNTAQNWRVGLILAFTVFLFAAPLINPETKWTFDFLNSLMGAFAEFGSLLMPLFGVVADVTAKSVYSRIRGVLFIGTSWTKI